MSRSFPRLGSAVLAMMTLHAIAAAATPISYRRTVRDDAGVRHRVTFTGEAAAGRLSGVLAVDGMTVDIVAEVGRDGSVSGKLTDRGSGAPGSFWGTFDPDQVLRGRFNLGAQGGEWTAPDFAMPVSALPTTDEGIDSE